MGTLTKYLMRRRKLDFFTGVIVAFGSIFQDPLSLEMCTEMFIDEKTRMPGFSSRWPSAGRQWGLDESRLTLTLVTVGTGDGCGGDSLSKCESLHHEGAWIKKKVIIRIPGFCGLLLWAHWRELTGIGGQFHLVKHFTGFWFVS